MTTIREAAASNDFAVSNMVASAAAEMLRAELVLGRVVFRDAETDFVGGVGSSVRIRVPKSIAPKKFEGSMNSIAQSIDEQTVSLELTEYVANPVDLTARDMSLNIKDFSSQVLAPQVTGAAEYIDQTIGKELQKKIDEKVSSKDTALVIDPAKPRDAIIDAGAKLDAARVPGTRILVVDPFVKAALLKDPNLTQVDQAGENDALRDAVIGKLYGFTVVMSPFIKGAIAMSNAAFAAAVKAPELPHGVFGKSQKDQDGQGYALTWQMTYNDDSDKERSNCKVFIGTTVIDPVRSVGLKLKTQDA